MFRCVHEFGVYHEEHSESLEIGRSIRRFELGTRLAVLRKNRRGKDERNLIVAPCFEDPAGHSAKEEAGEHDVRIKDDSHFRLRTVRTAAATSFFLRPDCLAAFRARPTISSNPDMSGL